MNHASSLFAVTETFSLADSILLNLLISLALPHPSVGKRLRALQQSKIELQSSHGNSGAQSLGQTLLSENFTQPPSHGQQRCHSHTLLQGLEGFWGDLPKFLGDGGVVINQDASKVSGAGHPG